jgi:hypothetical protein
MASIINATTSTGLVSSADNSGSLQLATNNGTTAVTIDTSQRVAFVAGTAALPAITTTGDTNTGVYFPAADTIAFSEGGAEAMRISSGGEVGIGSTATTYKLNIQNASASAFDGMKVAGDNASYNLVFQSGSVSASGTLFSVNKARGQFISSNNSPIAIGTLDAFPLVFGTNLTERMRIDSSDNVLIGTTDPTASGIGFKVVGGRPTTANAATSNSTTTYEAYSTGASAYRFYVGYGGTIFATSTSITGISDQRLKENIVDLDDGLNAVMALKPRKFDWKEGKGKDIKGDRGFIAQEFEAVFPDMIEEWKDPAPEGEEPYKAVNANLIPTLVKAIQELNAKVDAQAARIAELEGAR